MLLKILVKERQCCFQKAGEIKDAGEKLSVGVTVNCKVIIKAQALAPFVLCHLPAPQAMFPWKI